jgi:hypothetical protein
MTASCSTDSSPAWCSAAATNASVTGRARPRRCAAAAMSGSPPDCSRRCAGRAGRLRAADRPGPGQAWTETLPPRSRHRGADQRAARAPATTRDHLLLPATLDVLTGLLEQVGAVPGETTVHLDAGYDYRPCRAELAQRGLGSAISHRGNRRRSRSANGGSSSAPTPGSTTTAGSAAAPNGAGAASRPTSTLPPPSSPSALSFGPPGPAFALEVKTSRQTVVIGPAARASGLGVQRGGRSGGGAWSAG